MKSIILLSALSVFTTASQAQLWSLPPSSATDGVAVQDLGANAGESHWNDPSGLAAYAVSGDGNSDRITPGSIDSHLGLSWQTGPAENVTAIKSTLNATGGTIRAIYIGETAGWLNDFGYTYSGNPTAQSFTELQNIQSVGANPTVQFGQYIDVQLLPGQAANFDFWLNGVGATGQTTTNGPSANGGIYTAFNPASSGSAQSQFAWASTPLSVNTYVTAINGYTPVETYLVSAEDWRIGSGADQDYSDYRFALQFFDANGMPLAAIPEPASFAYALGSVALGIAAWKKRANFGRIN